MNPITGNRGAAELGRGFVRLLLDGKVVAAAANKWLYDWGFIVAQAAGVRAPGAGLNVLYVEFVNVATPATAAAIPTFDRTRAPGRPYYAGLGGQSDYLRIPISYASIAAAPGYEAQFGPGEGNLVTLYGQTAGVVGMNGLAFTAAANSKVIGVAAVAAPSLADASRDLVFGRAYYPVEKQAIRPPVGSFTVEYDLIFGTPTT